MKIISTLGALRVMLLIFGVMTVVAGGRNLFSESGISSRGNIVPLVLWFNFIAGFFYLLVGVLISKSKAMVKKLSIALAVANSLVLIYLGFYILQGGLYENKTIMAMSFRTILWISIAFYFINRPSFNFAKR